MSLQVNPESGRGAEEAAETIFTMEISEGGWTVGEFTHAYFFFEVVDPDNQIDVLASVFGALPLTEADLGRQFVSTSGTDPDFDPLVAYLRNGIDDFLSIGACIGDASEPNACGGSLPLESVFFGGTPDLQGEDIQSISFRVEEINIDPGPSTTWHNRFTFTIWSTLPPVALGQEVTVPAAEDCTADASVDAGSYHPDGDEITLAQEPPGPYGLGETDVLLTVSDGSLEDTYQAKVTVVDEAAPFVSCNAPPSISPWEVPVSFTATGTDNCELRRVLVRKPTCRRDWGDESAQVYSQDICHVVTQGDTITILNPGKSTEIRWLAKAIDQSGNRIVRRCSVDVVYGLPPVVRK